MAGRRLRAALERAVSVSRARRRVFAERARVARHRTEHDYADRWPDGVVVRFARDRRLALPRAHAPRARLIRWIRRDRAESRRARGARYLAMSARRSPSTTLTRSPLLNAGFELIEKVRRSPESSRTDTS